MTTTSRAAEAEPEEPSIDDLPKGSPKPGEVWRASHVAAVLDVTVRQVHTMFARGEIPGAFRIGRLWRIRRIDFYSWLESHGPAGSNA